MISCLCCRSESLGLLKAFLSKFTRRYENKKTFSGSSRRVYTFTIQPSSERQTTLTWRVARPLLVVDVFFLCCFSYACCYHFYLFGFYFYFFVSISPARVIQKYANFANLIFRPKDSRSSPVSMFFSEPPRYSIQ